MGHYTYYIEAKTENGEKVILRIQTHHSDLERFEEISVEQMEKEIKENNNA